ncbi:site-specific integrase [Bacteroidales bacterium OttesenSCG-928-I14]|nr:site-specific integrase [Bacteroidales bacterium OttesenSCG-928-I14]
MTSVNVVFRSSTRMGHFEGSLALRLILKRNTKEITLRGCKLYPEEWDKNKHNIIYPEEESSRFEYLRETGDKINREIDLVKFYLSELEMDGRYNLEDVEKLYRKRSSDNKLLGYSESLALNKESNGFYRTANAYRSSVRALFKFNKGEDILLKDINARLLKDFERYLIDHGKAKNTISYYMRNLRAIYNRAIVDKRIIPQSHEKPFINVYTGVAKTVKRSLDIDEIKRIEEIDFSREIGGLRRRVEQENIEKLKRAQLYFLFCVYARGMCFVDLIYLKKCNIKGNMLRYVRKKTGRQLNMKITAEMRAIIDVFAEEVKNSEYVFPILDKNKGDIRIQYQSALRIQNIRLKTLAKMAGISKSISTHVARHSWATMAKQADIPIHVISECMGHSSENVTLIYLGTLNNSLLDDANDKINFFLHQQYKKILQSGETTKP